MSTEKNNLAEVKKSNSKESYLLCIDIIFIGIFIAATIKMILNV